MKTKAAVLDGKNSIFIREFDLPQITGDELLVEVVSNSICLSEYKAAILGAEHKRVPPDISDRPIMTGHEFGGIIQQVGHNLKGRFSQGDKFVLQPAMGLENGYSAGYSFEYFGGNATYCIIPKIAIDLGCVLPFDGDYFADASLAEPMSCIIGAFRSNYHTKPFVYEHQMGILKSGNLAILGCGGPMGIGAIDYAINGPITPKKIVATDIDQERLNRTKSLLPPQEASKKDIELIYLNTNHVDPYAELIKLSDGKGYDDVFVLAPVLQLVELAGDILGNDGCLNFFAGPIDKKFKVPFNFYNVHYESTHVVGTSGGSTGDMMEAIELSTQGKIRPSLMVSHIGGLNAVPKTILNLPNIPGGKKLIYPHIDMDLVAIADFRKLGASSSLFKTLADICESNNNCWCADAEKYLLTSTKNKQHTSA